MLFVRITKSCKLENIMTIFAINSFNRRRVSNTRMTEYSVIEGNIKMIQGRFGARGPFCIAHCTARC